MFGLILCLLACGMSLWAQQSAEAKPPAAEDAKPATEAAEARKRVELNLLGKADTSAGESRRNENVQFNLIDNNALKELNVRLGASATIVQEFRPDRTYFSSEFGNAPSAVLALPQSARAGWHGNLYFNHLNSVFSARSFFQVGSVRPALEHRYGFQTGFRPWRRAYLSLSGAQDKLRGNVNGNVLVPLFEERTPLTANPEERALIARFLAAYPLPNRGDVYSRALNQNAVQVIDNEEAGARLEQEISNNDRLLWNYQFIGQSVEAFQLVAGQNPDTRTKSHRARITWLRQWSAASGMAASAGFDRVGSLLVPDEAAVGPMVSTAGLTTLGPTGNIPIDRAQNVYRFSLQLDQSRGPHRLVAGMALARRQFNGIETDTHRGFISFSNDFGRTGIENLLRGTPTQYILSVGDVHRGMRQWMPAVYAGDTWKPRSDLTLQLGIRYEWLPTPREVNDRNRVPYGCDCNNLSPSLGLAYQLPRTWGVLRTAGTVQYGEILPVTYSQIRFSPPGSVKLAIPAPDLLDPLRALKTTGQQPDAKGNLYLLDPEMASPYAYQYNFSWEPGFSRTWRLQLGYAGSRMHKLIVMWYLNRAHPTPGVALTTATINQRRANRDLAEIRWVLNGSRGYFDAARVSLVAPRYKGLTLDAAYWFSKAMDLGADYTNTGYDADSRLSRSQSEFETHRDRKALSLFHQPHAFLVRASYQLPKPGWQTWTRRLVENWSASSVALLKTGTPFTVTTLDGPGFGNVDGNGNDRPNLLDPSVLGRTVGDPATSRQMLPSAAFARIAEGAQTGSLGAGTFRKGPIRNVNAALARSWKLWNDARLNFRAESINLLNTPQFAEPGAVWGTPEFGFITNTLNEGRTFRFGVGVSW
ncbi:MAG: hypothetical protein JNL98_13880 [Bryobacterales bacterium]|nr:hypothetical protein [Bryobacterales bacterium]